VILYDKIRGSLIHIETLNNHESLNAGFVGNIIQSYLLPFLAGFLGTLAFVLRNISRKVQNCSYSKVSQTDFKLRVTLGSLAGILAGWILPTKSFELSVSPHVLSFIAGYNIEVIFRTFDFLILKYLNTIKDSRKKIENQEPEKRNENKSEVN
jgi:hypothetical protein